MVSELESPEVELDPSLDPSLVLLVDSRPLSLEASPPVLLEDASPELPPLEVVIGSDIVDVDGAPVVELLLSDPSPMGSVVEEHATPSSTVTSHRRFMPSTLAQAERRRRPPKRTALDGDERQQGVTRR